MDLQSIAFDRFAICPKNHFSIPSMNANKSMNIVIKNHNPKEIQTGDVTQIQDQVMYPVNLRPTKSIVKSVTRFDDNSFIIIDLFVKI